MTTAQRARIGFDRTLPPEWLDAAAARVMTGESAEATRDFLWKFLEGIEPGDTNNSCRGKTLTVLSRIWVSVPAQAEPLRRSAIEALASVSGEQRIALHWAMVAATHPFFLDVATHAGKLIKLHGYASRTQIKRRMTESWGDRSTLERTIQHVLKSLTKWRLLRPGPEHGSVAPPSQPLRLNGEVSRLVARAILLSGGAMPASQLANHAALFPFALDLPVSAMKADPAFEVHRQGDRSDVIELV